MKTEAFTQTFTIKHLHLTIAKYEAEIVSLLFGVYTSSFRLTHTLKNWV